MGSSFLLLLLPFPLPLCVLRVGIFLNCAYTSKSMSFDHFQIYNCLFYFHCVDVSCCTRRFFRRIDTLVSTTSVQLATPLDSRNMDPDRRSQKHVPDGNIQALRACRNSK